jgi:hypothetical protein
MEWLQAFMIAGSTIGGCYWMHRENRQMASEFQKESKDFHGRLCTLEERYLQMMQKFLEDKK